jgi:hypothetical protein
VTVEVATDLNQPGGQGLDQGLDLAEHGG